MKSVYLSVILIFLISLLMVKNSGTATNDWFVTLGETSACECKDNTCATGRTCAAIKSSGGKCHIHCYDTSHLDTSGATVPVQTCVFGGGAINNSCVSPAGNSASCGAQGACCDGGIHNGKCID